MTRIAWMIMGMNIDGRKDKGLLKLYTALSTPSSFHLGPPKNILFLAVLKQSPSITSSHKSISSDSQFSSVFISTNSTHLAASFFGQSWLVLIFYHFSPGHWAEFYSIQNERLWCLNKQGIHQHSVVMSLLLHGIWDKVVIVLCPFYICALPSFHVQWGFVVLDKV